MTEQWCDYQHKCKEDTEDTWTCIAHMAEGRAFQCPYTKEHIHPDARNKPVFLNSEGWDGVCQDYKPFTEGKNEERK